jgi:hypothetical protein
LRRVAGAAGTFVSLITNNVWYNKQMEVR